MDDNDKPIAYGVSHVDGVTPVAIQFDSNRKMYLDYTTTILFDPAITTAGTNRYPLMKATSSADNKTIKQWVINAFTGAVLATKI